MPSTTPNQLTTQSRANLDELDRIAGLPSGAARRTAVLERVRRDFPDVSAELQMDFALADMETVGYFRGLLGAA